MKASLWLLCLCVTLVLRMAFCDDCSQVTQSSTVCSQENQVCIVPIPSVTNTRNAGTVFVCRNRRWGNIDNSNPSVPWSEKNSQVACIQAGFNGALNSIYTLTIPVLPDTAPAHFTDVVCDGTEQFLVNCSFTYPMEFTSIARVIVVCRPELFDYSDVHERGIYDGDLRLFGDSSNERGFVEMFVGGLGWTTFCPDGFDDGDAAVLCRQFGYQAGTAVNFPVSDAIRRSSSLGNAECADQTPSNIGTSFVAGKCRFDVFSSCVFSTRSGVQCTQDAGKLDGSIRLVGTNGLPTTSAGIVEVLFDRRWGMVCGSNIFALNEARAVCEQLNLEEDDAAIMSANSFLDGESRMKPVWLSNVDCDNEADMLTTCPRSSPIGYGPCTGSQQLAAVRCGQPSGPSGGFSTNSITGIIIAIVFVLFFLVPLGYYFGRDYWRKRHQYSWYNTLTSPGEWCDCDCCSSPTPERSFALQRNVTTVNEPVSTEPAAEPVRFGGFARQSSGSSAGSQPALTVNESEAKEPGLTNVPPPAYNAAGNFPSVTNKPPPAQDLPPPYAGPSVGFVYSPTGAPPANDYPGYPPEVSSQDPAYPPPTAPPPTSPPPSGPPSSAPYPVDPAYPPPVAVDPAYPPPGAVDPAYPPPVAVDPAYPPPGAVDPAYPPPGAVDLPYPVNMEPGGGAYPPPTVHNIDS